MKGRGRALFVLGAFLVALLAAASALGAVGSLTYRSCISGDSSLGPAGNGACTPTLGTSIGGHNSGLDDLFDVAVNSAGNAVYSVSLFDDAIAGFNRNSAGNLTFTQCMTGETQSGSPGSGGTGACIEAAGATSMGANSGFDGLTDVITSPSGSVVYTLSSSDAAIGRFTGVGGGLTYRGCGTAERESSVVLGGPCADGVYSTPSSNATNTGLDSPRALAISANGEDAYAVSGYDDAVTTFSRTTTAGPFEGALTWETCITGEKESGPVPDGSGACTPAFGINTGGTDNGFNGLEDVAVSPDGKSVYAVSYFDDAVLRFDRDLVTGALTYHSCITGELESGAACVIIGSATSQGSKSGMDGLVSLAISPDGNHVYAAASNDSSIVRFDRDGDGTLSYGGCLTGDSEVGPAPGSGACAALPTARPTFGIDSGISGARDLVLSPDGKSLYVASESDNAITIFDRDVTTGALVRQGCISADANTGPTGSGACVLTPTAQPNGSGAGLDIISLAISPDGSSLYTAARIGDSVTTFGRQVLPDPAPPAGGDGGEGGGDGPPTEPGDTSGPQQTLAGKRKQDVDKLKVAVILDEAGALEGTARVNVPKGKVLVKSKRVGAQPGAGQRTVLRFKFAKRALRRVKAALADGKRLKATIEVIATDGAGNASTATKRVRLTD